MADTALDLAQDLTGAVTADPRRSLRQTITYSILCLVIAGLIVAVIPLALSAWGFWFLVALFVVALLIGLLSIVSVVTTSGRRVIGVSPRGMFVPSVDHPVPWDEIASVAATRYPNRVAAGVAGRLAMNAVAAGGVHDGGRDLDIVLKDADAWRARLGPTRELLIMDAIGGVKGADGFHVDLSLSTDAASFESFVLAVKAQADAHGVPILITSH